MVLDISDMNGRDLKDVYLAKRENIQKNKEQIYKVNKKNIGSHNAIAVNCSLKTLKASEKKDIF